MQKSLDAVALLSSAAIMSRKAENYHPETEPPKNIGELLDQIERIREELHTIQRTLEAMEPKKDGSTQKARNRV